MPVEHELVLRKKGEPYIRKAPSRDFDSSSEFRKQTMVNFSELAILSRGKKYEEVIKTIQEGMNPVGRKVKERIIELTPDDLAAIKLKMLNEGITTLRFPVGYSIRVKPAIPLEKIEKLILE